MKSAALGQSTSLAEVTNVSPHGFWLFVGERELFVPFNQFPWFREASVREIANVQLPSPHHLYWPGDLDPLIQGNEVIAAAGQKSSCLSTFIKSSLQFSGQVQDNIFLLASSWPNGAGVLPPVARIKDDDPLFFGF